MREPFEYGNLDRGLPNVPLRRGLVSASWPPQRPPPEELRNHLDVRDLAISTGFIRVGLIIR